MNNISTEQKKRFDENGYLIVDQLIPVQALDAIHRAFDDLFAGCFETGVSPDEVNWQQETGDPSLTRQICNGWKANRQIARILFDESIAAAIGELSGWPGVRIMIDNVIWKPPGAKSLGYHQDSSYLDWLNPSELLTCWIALDDTTADGGTMELVRSSHRWQLSKPDGQFHAPQNYRETMQRAARREGVEQPIIDYVEVSAGGGSFHHGWTWHGSGSNRSERPRRSLVLHAMRSDAEYEPEYFGQGIGPIYSRYKRLGDNRLDENYFPILWSEEGYRTPQIEDYLAKDLTR